MGRLQAEEMAEFGTMEQAIKWHLRSNHYPPIPISMVQPCIDAIIAVNDGNYNEEISLPEGVTYKGDATAPAWVVVEQHHLDAWLTWEDEE